MFLRRRSRGRPRGAPNPPTLPSLRPALSCARTHTHTPLPHTHTHTHTATLLRDWAAAAATLTGRHTPTNSPGAPGLSAERRGEGERWREGKRGKKRRGKTSLASPLFFRKPAHSESVCLILNAKQLMSTAPLPQSPPIKGRSESEPWRKGAEDRSVRRTLLLSGSS